MRSIYRKKIIDKIEQGNIINFCYSEKYKDKDVFGIIITPRCDIENSKVPTLHYLPIVNFADWLIVDLWEILRGRLQKEINGTLANILNSLKLSPSILQFISSAAILDMVDNNTIYPIKKVEQLKELFLLKEKVESQSLDNETKISIIKHKSKLTKNILTELRDNKLKEFYLLEDWDINNHDYKIILTREIGSISLDICKKIAKGCWGGDIKKDDITNNSFGKVNDESFLEAYATLNSPIVEHLVQHFFLNFGRIGIEDHEYLDDDNIFAKLIK